MIARKFYERGLLKTVYHWPRVSIQEKGILDLNLDRDKKCLLKIPEMYNPDKPAPFALMLHGSGGEAAHGISYLGKYAEQGNIIILSAQSKAYSWDIIANHRFGVDVIFIDRALEYIFTHLNINKSRIAIGGFSDGASYALSLGLANGGLFTHIIAFSPGFAHADEIHGQPRIFISHGTSDKILGIERCSRKIVRQLRNEGFSPDYVEFDGEHEIPEYITKQAVDFFLKSLTESGR